MYPLLENGMQVPPNKQGLLSQTDFSHINPKKLHRDKIYFTAIKSNYVDLYPLLHLHSH